MTLVRNGLDAAEGTVATTGTTGGSIVAIGSGNSMVHTSQAAAGSGTGIRFTAGGTNAGAIRWNLAAPNTLASWSIVWRVPQGTFSADVTPFTIYDTGGARIGSLTFHNATGRIVFNDKSSTYTQILPQASATPGTLFRYELTLQVGTTTSNGSWTAKAYAIGGSTPVGTGSSTTANLGTVAQNNLNFAPSATIATTYDFDNIQYNDGSNAEIGPYVPPSNPPTLRFTQGGPFRIVDARTSSASQSGTMTYDMTYVSGPQLTYTEPFEGYFLFTPDTDDDAVYQLKATESGNSSGTPTQNVTIPALQTVVNSTTTSLTETVVLKNGQWG